MEPVIAYLGLGSNLDNPLEQVARAAAALKAHPQVLELQLSPLYESKAVGPAGQPDYVNAAVRVETTLDPIKLLDLAQRIELDQGRVRLEHWGPRTIDLDILLYGNGSIDTPRLTIPHRFLKQRNFVLAPLVDLTPTLCLPDGTPAGNLLQQTGMAGLRRLSAFALPSTAEVNR